MLAAQEEEFSFFIDMMAQSRVEDRWIGLEGTHIYDIVPGKQNIQFDVLVAGDSFENSSVSARLMIKS